MAGRSTKLTKKMQDEIVQYLQAGNYINTVSAFVGISKDTFFNWMKRGAREKERLEKSPSAKPKKNEKIYLDFSIAVKKAMAHAEIRDVTLIGQAAKENWQAAAWRLERKYPDKWGRKDRLEAEMQHKASMDVNVKDKTDAELDKEIAELKNRLGINQDG